MATMAYAIFQGSLLLVQDVINERGFDCNAPNTSWTNVLEMAVRAGQLKIVQYLVGEEPMDLAQDSSEPGGSIYDLAVSLDPTSFL